MSAPHPRPTGIWLPLVTPFRDGHLDEASLRRLVRYYTTMAIDGFILAATTGEGLTLERSSQETRLAGRVPVIPVPARPRFAAQRALGIVHRGGVIGREADAPA